MSGVPMGTTGSSWNPSGMQSTSRGHQSGLPTGSHVRSSAVGSSVHRQSVAPSAMGPSVRRQSNEQSAMGPSVRQSDYDNKEYDNSSPSYNPDININKISVC